MYANINEAWNTMSIFPEYNTDYTVEPQQLKMLGTKITKPKEDNEETYNEETYKHFTRESCDYYLNHVMNCSKCYNKIIKNKNNNFLNDDIKEIIIIILIGIIIIFIIDLFVKSLKRN